MDSITSFSKTGLKKTVTVDKSGPLIEVTKPKSAAGGDNGGASDSSTPAPKASGGGGGDMMSEMMAKRGQMKKADPKPAAAAAPKPAPPAEPKPAAPAAPKPASGASAAKPAPPQSPKPAQGSSSDSGSTSGLSPEFQALKQEILDEIRRELFDMKNEILEAIKNQ